MCLYDCHIIYSISHTYMYHPEDPKEFTSREYWDNSGQPSEYCGQYRDTHSGILADNTGTPIAGLLRTIPGFLRTIPKKGFREFCGQYRDFCGQFRKKYSRNFADNPGIFADNTETHISILVGLLRERPH